MIYRQILLVRATWETEAELKAEYILRNKIELREMGPFCLWGAKMLNKQYVQDVKRDNPVMMEHDIDHLGVFRANLNEAHELIDRYACHIMTPYMRFDTKEEARRFRDKYSHPTKSNEIFCVFVEEEHCGHIEVAEMMESNDPRLTSRDYFVVPFVVHR